jgi:L-iditol 2-dehydrogenase
MPVGPAVKKYRKERRNMAENFKEGKAIIFEEKNKAVVKNILFADIDEQAIVVKTKYSGISAGTEMAVFAGQESENVVRFPCVPGYEEVGEVVYVGPKAPLTNSRQTVKVGDRVMANEVRYYPDYFPAWGGQCEYAVKTPRTSPADMDKVAKIPDNVSYQEAVVAYLACVAKKGVDMVGINPGETVVVVGMGQIGLSDLQLLNYYGAGKIIAADIRDNRLKFAEKYTALTVNLSDGKGAEKIKEINNGKEADVAIECSGDPAAVNPLADYVRAGGRVHLQGQYRQPITVTEYARWNCKDLRISCSIALSPGNKEEILKMISEGSFDAKGLYSMEYSVDRAPEAYQELKNHRYEHLKILFRWEDK